MDRVALYLQDAHSLADGIKYAQYAEKKCLILKKMCGKHIRIED